MCGKLQSQVTKLIVGLHGAVCSDCIDLCCDILRVARPEIGHHAQDDGAAEPNVFVDVPPHVAKALGGPDAVLHALTILARMVERRATALAESSRLPDQP